GACNKSQREQGTTDHRHLQRNCAATKSNLTAYFAVPGSAWTCSARMRTLFLMTCRKPPRTWNLRVTPADSTRNTPDPSTVIRGAWLARMPTSPSNAGATTESASPSNTADSGD